MVVLSIGDPDGFDADLFNISILRNGSLGTATDSLFRITVGATDTVATFRGTGFRFDGDGPVAGQVASFSVTRESADLFRLSGLALAATSVVAIYESLVRSDDVALLAGALAGADTIAGGTGPDRLRGLDGNDIIGGGIRDDRTFGDAGADRLSGQIGDDTLWGGTGRDALFGAGGTDVLIGGSGRDFLIGGDGADRFVFDALSDSQRSAPDILRDFDPAADRIDLSAIDADVDGAAGDQAFSFIRARAFTGTAGELRFENGRLLGDVDGKGRSDFAIEVRNVAALTPGDFIL